MTLRMLALVTTILVLTNLNFSAANAQTNRSAFREVKWNGTKPIFSNGSHIFELRPGESVEEGPVIVKLDACERTAPYEFPQETGAFVQLDVLEPQVCVGRVAELGLLEDGPGLGHVALKLR